MDNRRTTAGAELLSCDLDETCAVVDCEAMMKEFGDTLMETSEGAAVVAHYCGLDSVGKLAAPHAALGEEAEYS